MTRTADGTVVGVNVSTPTVRRVPDEDVDVTPVTCAWCPKVATGWARWKNLPDLLYPSCGHRRHGITWRANTARRCAACGAQIPEQRDSRALFCSDQCRGTGAGRRLRERERAARLTKSLADH